MSLAPTPKDRVYRDGTAELYRFRSTAPRRGTVLLVPSLINRWYVLDLRPGASVAAALVEAGLDVFCLDWGAPHDEDRHLEWDAVVARLARAIRRVRREAGADRIGLLGYCLGGTLASIATALEPDSVGALVNLAGPIDFAHAGLLGHLTNPRWFDAEAIASAGNLHPAQMQAGFSALRPTAELAKWVSLFDKLGDPEKTEAFLALEQWARDNVAFPAAAYVRYIQELYQSNQLVQGEHRIAGRRVELGAIRCPILTVVADRDTICPPPAAQALADRAGSTDVSLLMLRGGHVGAVVGARAATELYPPLARWLSSRLGAPTSLDS